MQYHLKNPKKELLLCLGVAIKNFRNPKVFSQFNLSVEAGLPKTQVGWIERAEINTTVYTLKLISDAFDITLSELLESVWCTEVVRYSRRVKYLNC